MNVNIIMTLQIDNDKNYIQVYAKLEIRDFKIALSCIDINNELKLRWKNNKLRVTCIDNHNNLITINVINFKCLIINEECEIVVKLTDINEDLHDIEDVAVFIVEDNVLKIKS